MRLSLCLSLGLAMIVTAQPIILTPRQGATIQAIEADASATMAVVNNDRSTMMTAVQNSASDVTAQLALIASITSAAQDIKSQLQNAALSVASSTKGLATSLTAPEAAALAATMDNIKTLAGAMTVDYQTMKAQLSADTFSAVKSEYSAAAAAVKPFADPLMTYSTGVKVTGQTAASNAGAALLSSASGLRAAVGILLASVGL